MGICLKVSTPHLPFAAASPILSSVLPPPPVGPFWRLFSPPSCRFLSPASSKSELTAASLRFITPFVMYPSRLAFGAFRDMLSRVESYVQLENWKPHCCSSNGNLGQGRKNYHRPIDQEKLPIEASSPSAAAE